MKLGLVSAVVLAIAGGTLSVVQPGLQASKLSAPAREVFAAVATAILDGSLPASGAARDKALAGLLDRIDALAANLPDHAQAELSRLLAILSTAPGRMLIAGLQQPWDSASVAQIQEGLQAMRLSTLSARQQAYQALHDIVGGAYFADPQTWAALGYPGPVAV